MPLSSWLILAVSVDIQLLAKRGLFDRVRGLSLEDCERQHGSTAVLHRQYYLHLVGPERTLILLVNFLQPTKDIPDSSFPDYNACIYHASIGKGDRRHCSHG